jgi:quercetin dioxygenase-like cupin family protein
MHRRLANARHENGRLADGRSTKRRAIRVARISCLSLLAVLLLGGRAFAEAPAQGPRAFAADDPRLEWGPCPEFIPEGCRIAVLQGDPEQRNADVFFKLPPGVEAPHHWHTSAERMVLVSGELRVTYDGHEPLVLTPGTYAYGPAKLPHTAACADGDPCVLFIAFEEPVDAVPTE